MDKGKVVTTAILSFFTNGVAVLTGWLGIMAIPVYLLVACNIVDYITGLIAAKNRNQTINSDKGLKGITKKVCMWILICVGAMVDVLINYAVNVAGLHITVPFIVAVIIAIWLIVNELISIVENLHDIGVKIPKFLLPLLKNIKKQVDNPTTKVGGNDEQS